VMLLGDGQVRGVRGFLRARFLLLALGGHTGLVCF